MTLAVLLLGAGVLFLVAEGLFPSFGALGLLAFACLIGSVVAAFGVSSETGMWFLLAVAVLVPAAILLGMKLLPHNPLTKKLVARGFTFEDGAAVDPRDRALLGAEGVLESPLRPAGVARIAGRRVDVVTRGEALERGARVRVLEVRGNRVVVAALEDGVTDGSGPSGPST